MNKIMAWMGSCLFSLSCLFSTENGASAAPPEKKVVIVGGGIIGAMESYFAYLDSLKTGTKTRVAVYEKGPSFEEGAPTNTAYHISASLTADEILSVVPRGSELLEKLAIRFSEPGGIRTDDVPGANDSPVALRFIDAVGIYGNDVKHEDRTRHLLELGKRSMDLWQELYDQADDEMKQILIESNFHPCHEPSKKELHDGYRIDLLYGIPNAEDRAKRMRDTYQSLGYGQCQLLSPQEVVALDPYVSDYCQMHSDLDGSERIWKKDCAALWRPGGCLSSHDFLPKIYKYLQKAMGTYQNESGEPCECFSIEFNKEVTEVVFDGQRIAELKFADGSSEKDESPSQYVFCPGEAIGTLDRLGFDEPAYSGFAGASLYLRIPLLQEQLDAFKRFSHCMEVHKIGIVLAWQARFNENQLIIGVAGTKAFYADQLPNLNQEFAKNRHLVQLNMINDVLPEMVSIACGFDTKGMQMLPEHVSLLEEKGILEKWVGRRAVAYDGFPTLGALYWNGIKVANGRCTTHLGSGGVSFSPAAVQISRDSENPEEEFTQEILRYADSRRHP